MFAFSPVLHSAPDEPPVFSLSALRLGIPDFPALYVSALAAGSDGKRAVSLVPLDVPDQSPGSEVQIPAGSAVRLYSGVNGGPPAPGAAPYLELPAPSAGTAGGKVVLVFHYGPDGKLRQDFVEASISKHPAGSVRLVNLAGKRVAFSVGSSPQPVQPGGEATATPVPGEKGRFPFTYYEERPGETPYQSPRANLRFRFPDHRLLVIFTHQREETPTGEVGSDGQEKMAASYRLRPIFVFDRCGGAPAKTAATPAPAKPEREVVVAPEPPALRAEVISLGGVGEISVSGGKAPVKMTPTAGEFAKLGGQGAGPLTVARSETPSQALAIVEPATANRLLVLAEGESGQCRAAVFDDSPLSHPEGRIRVFNMTPYQLAYSKPGKALDYIDPLEAAVVDPGAEPLKLAAKAREGWVLVSSEQEPALLPGTRGYLFVSKKAGAETFNVLKKSR